jgi:hypothetical protein
MNIYRETPGILPFNPELELLFKSPAPPDGSPVVNRRPERRARRSLPEGWRKLSTGLRGAWLYVVTLHNGGAYWLVEVMHDGAELRRRFASELHARAWLKDLIGPATTPASFDWEEMNAPLRGEMRDAYDTASWES